jgi:hypothetical protein
MYSNDFLETRERSTHPASITVLDNVETVYLNVAMASQRVRSQQAKNIYA